MKTIDKDYETNKKDFDCIKKIISLRDQSHLADYYQPHPNGSVTLWILAQRENGSKLLYFKGMHGWTYGMNASKDTEKFIKEFSLKKVQLQ
jgi:hypothetical protein